MNCPCLCIHFTGLFLLNRHLCSMIWVCHENPPSIDPFIGDVSKQKHASTNHAAIKMELDVGNILYVYQHLPVHTTHHRMVPPSYKLVYKPH